MPKELIVPVPIYYPLPYREGDVVPVIGVAHLSGAATVRGVQPPRIFLIEINSRVLCFF
jgi:hypothetical protein